METQAVSTTVKLWLSWAQLVERFGEEAAERLVSEAPRRERSFRPAEFLVVVEDRCKRRRVETVREQ